MLKVADQHQRLAEVLHGLEHKARLIGGDLEQNAAGLAEVNGFEHLAIQNRCRPSPAPVTRDRQASCSRREW